MWATSGAYERVPPPVAPRRGVMMLAAAGRQVCRACPDKRARAHRQHATHANLGRCGVDADFNEVRAEGRLLVLLVEVAIFDRVLGDDAALARGFGERRAAIAPVDLAVRKHGFGGVEAEFLRY